MERVTIAVGYFPNTEFLLTIYIRSVLKEMAGILLNNADKNSALMTISLKEKMLCRVSRIVFGNMTTHCGKTYVHASTSNISSYARL